MTIDELEAAALELSARERARLTERRYEELRTGRDAGLPLEGFRIKRQFAIG